MSSPSANPSASIHPIDDETDVDLTTVARSEEVVESISKIQQGSTYRNSQTSKRISQGRAQAPAPGAAAAALARAQEKPVIDAGPPPVDPLEDLGDKVKVLEAMVRDFPALKTMSTSTAATEFGTAKLHLSTAAFNAAGGGGGLAMSLKASSISVSGLGTSLMNRTAPLGLDIRPFGALSVDQAQAVVFAGSSFATKPAVQSFFDDPTLRDALDLNLTVGQPRIIQPRSDDASSSMNAKTRKNIFSGAAASVPLAGSRPSLFDRALRASLGHLGARPKSNSTTNLEIVGAAISEAVKMVFRLVLPIMGIATYTLDRMKEGCSLFLAYKPSSSAFHLQLKGDTKLYTFTPPTVDPNTPLPPARNIYSIDIKHVPTSDTMTDHDVIDDVLDRLQEQYKLSDQVVQTYSHRFKCWFPTCDLVMSRSPFPYTRTQQSARTQTDREYFRLVRNPPYHIRKPKSNETKFSIRRISSTAGGARQQQVTEISGLNTYEEAEAACTCLTVAYKTYDDCSIALWFGLLHVERIRGATEDELLEFRKLLLPTPDSKTFWCDFCWEQYAIEEFGIEPVTGKPACASCIAGMGATSATSRHNQRAHIRRATNPMTSFDALHKRVQKDAELSGRDVPGSAEELKTKLIATVPEWAATTPDTTECAFAGDVLGLTFVQKKPPASGDTVIKGLGHEDHVPAIHDVLSNVVPTSMARNNFAMGHAKQLLIPFFIEMLAARLLVDELDETLFKALDALLVLTRQVSDDILLVSRSFDFPKKAPHSEEPDLELPQRTFARVALFDQALSPLIELDKLGCFPGTILWLRARFEIFGAMDMTVEEATAYAIRQKEDFPMHLFGPKHRKRPSDKVKECVRSLAAAIEAAWGFKFEYFDGWPSYFNSTDVQTLTSRGQKVTGTLLTREMNLRYLRELRECNIHFVNENMTFTTTYGFYLLLLASDDWTDKLLGQQVELLREGAAHSGGAGHLLQGQTMHSGFSLRQPDDLSSYDSETINTHIRTWHARQFNHAVQDFGTKSKEAAGFDLMGIFEFVRRLFEARAVKCDGAVELSKLFNDKLASADFDPIKHIKHLFPK